MVCPKCASEIADEAIYCGKCGAKTGGKQTCTNASANKNTQNSLCAKCGAGEAREYTVYLSKTVDNIYEFLGDRQIALCDGCAKKHGHSRLLSGVLMIAGGVLVGSWVFPTIAAKIAQNANINGLTGLIEFLFYMFASVLSVGLVVAGIAFIVRSASGRAALGFDLARDIAKSAEKEEGVAADAKPPSASWFYSQLSDLSLSKRHGAAHDLLRLYHEDSLPYFLKALQSKEEYAIDTALFALDERLSQIEPPLSADALNRFFAACLPSLNNLLQSKKLGAGARFFDNATKRTLSLLERYGDASSLPALRSLLMRALYRRHQTGHLREYVVTSSSKDTCDNDSCDDEVRGVLDAVAARCGLNAGDFYPSAGPIEQKETVLRQSEKLYDNGDGTVSDYENKLMWQKEDDGQARDFAAAATYCAQMRLGGHANWRLPKLEELKTIAHIGAAANTHPLFTNAKNERYWTKSEFGFVLDGRYQGKTVAYVVDFADGGETTYAKAEPFFVRAVRSLSDEELPQTRYCRHCRQSVEIRPLTGYATCVRSLPVEGCCKQSNCIYHNSMSIAVFLRKAMFNEQSSNREVWAALGARDYCGK